MWLCLCGAADVGIITAAQKNPVKQQTPPAKPAAASKSSKAVKPEAEARPFDISFKQFTLSNGLRVLLAEDHHAPTYSICVTDNAGSRDERPGRTGFAHLFEYFFFFSSRRRHTRLVSDWSSDVCSSD